MKGNIKKLAVFVIIAAIAIFTVVGVTWAVQPVPAIRYAYTGGGNCLISPTGFTNYYTPNDPTQAFSSLVVVEGVITLNRNGSGSIENVTRFLDLPGVINIANETWKFMYSSDRNGFTIYPNEGSYIKLDWQAGPNLNGPNPLPNPMYFVFDGSCDAVVSHNGDTATITCGQPLLTLKVAACDLTKSPPCTPLSGPFGYCSFSWVGTRINKVDK